MSTAVPPTQTPRGWRAYGIVTGLFATVAVVAAMLLPWFERRDPSGRAQTYTPWQWGDPNAASAPETPLLSLQIAELIFRREWGLSFVIAAASGALIAFIAASRRPTEDRISRATTVNIVAAVIALVLVLLMAIAFVADGGGDASIAPRIGFFVGVPAVIGWLGYGIAFAKVGATARRNAVSAPNQPASMPVLREGHGEAGTGRASTKTNTSQTRDSGPA